MFSFVGNMKLFFVLVLLAGQDMVVAGPAQCNLCFSRDAGVCSFMQRNQTCATDRDSLGTTHCGSAAIKYLDGNVISTGIIRLCIDCADNKTACFVLGGFLKDSQRTLLQCEIECCTGDNCNTQTPTLSQDAITVFSPNASGPTQCQECLEDDRYACNLHPKPQNCSTDLRSLGRTHCGSAEFKYRDDRHMRDGVFRGCIDCSDKRAACAVIGGYLKKEKRYTLSECEIECCTGDNCNDGVDGPGQCNACVGGNANSCVTAQQSQTCLTDKASLGTTHCGSAAIKYEDGSGDNKIKTGFIRGCFNCTDKKAACFTLGGYLKIENWQTLLQCEIECCNSSNCNNQAPTLTQDAITVFTPDAAGPSQCRECFDDDELECFEEQGPQTCRSFSRSLGTTHCGSAKIKYWSVYGVRNRVFRGCINCADTEAACASIGGYVKSRRRGILLDCEIECCTGNNCNGVVPTISGVPTCNFCLKQDAASCSNDQIPIACPKDSAFHPLETTQCGSAVGKVGHRSGIQDIFYRGCFNCADKKATCFALGGYLKGYGRRQGTTPLNLLQCEIECCTGSNCNTQTFPSLSKNAVNVFTPAASGPRV